MKVVILTDHLYKKRLKIPKG